MARKLTPVDIKGDSGAIHEALNRMFVRTAQLARKRPSPLDTIITLASVDIIVALENYFAKGCNVEESVARIDDIFK